jgi:hydrophobic/amphiphilic exporter-1 (mainly G- bacteria), HAE1 family
MSTATPKRVIWSRMLFIPPVLLGLGVLIFAARLRTGAERVPEEEVSRTLRVIQVARIPFVPRAMGYGDSRPARIWEAVAEVFVTLWLFFNWRLSFWVAASLPVSFLGAMFFMPLLGLSINMFTLLGMLLALGILMDDGIVIAENVAAHRARSATAMQAAIEGVSEVAAGVFSSFITTVCVLGPLAFISGRIGEVLGVIPVMLIVVLSISLTEAFFILPAHLEHALEHGDLSKSNRWRRRIDSAFEFLRERVFGTLVDAAVSHRYLTLGLAVGALLATTGLLASGTLKFLPFPQVEGDTVVARVALPAGTPLERTESVMQAMSAGLDRVNSNLQPAQPERQPLVLNRTLEYGINTEAFESGPHVATMTVELLTVDQRTARIDDVIAAWKQEVGSLADVMLLTISADSFGPAGRPIELRLKGNDLTQLKLASEEALAWFSQFKGVRNMSDDLRQGKPEVQLRLATGATALGLTTSSVAEQVRAGFQGVDIGEVQFGSESRTINVGLELPDRNGLSDLDSFPISLADGKLVPLATVANHQATRGWSRISRADRSRAVTMFGDVDSRITSGSALVARFRSEQAGALLDRFPGVQFDFGGETKESRTTVVSPFNRCRHRFGRRLCAAQFPISQLLRAARRHGCHSIRFDRGFLGARYCRHRHDHAQRARLRVARRHRS